MGMFSRELIRRQEIFRIMADIRKALEVGTATTDYLLDLTKTVAKTMPFPLEDYLNEMKSQSATMTIVELTEYWERLAKRAEEKLK